MLVLGKRTSPGSAAAQRADSQEAGATNGIGAVSVLARLSRPHREITAVPAAGSTPPRAGGNRAPRSANGADRRGRYAFRY